MEEGVSLSLLEEINKSFDTRVLDLRTYSPLTLAYIGDAVYDLIVRTLVVENANMRPQNLHKEAIKYVSAKAQAKIVDIIMEDLSEEEQNIYRRGKNGKPHSTAKNATTGEYHKATGFEALIGYLYLSGQTGRMLEIVRTGIDSLKE